MLKWLRRKQETGHGEAPEPAPPRVPKDWENIPEEWGRVLRATGDAGAGEAGKSVFRSLGEPRDG